MKTAVRIVKLSVISDLNPKFAGTLGDDEAVSFVPMSAVDEVTAGTAYSERRLGEVRKGYTPFLNGDVLVAKITPCFENGKIAQANIAHRMGFGSTEFHVVRPRNGSADARYLMHFLRQERVRREGERKMTGSAGQRRVPEHFLANLKIPLPPLPEQRRIAEVLDRVDALRAMRRAALAQLDELTRAIFFEMFGDPVMNPKGWAVLRFREVLSTPLRNGLSPSKIGKMTAKVLTLSAITGERFDPTAWKTSTFQSMPPTDQTVDEADFLICRGNGNVRLVGKGYYPRRRMPDTAFPDTMIAARVEPNRIDRHFLEHVWNSVAVRQQVELLARTTNGTFKVNQTMLEGITFTVPPISLQRTFARHVAAVEKLQSAHRAALTELDALFASLQHRAFRGAL